MKKILGMTGLLLVAGGVFLLAGCAKHEAPASSVAEQARQELRDGVVFLKQGDAVKAVQSFAAAIKTSPDYFEAYYMLAETFIHLKQFDQAQAVLTAATGRFPENPVAYYLLGIAHEGAGELMPAIVSARKSVDLFQAKKDDEGVKRAMVLLGALVQLAKKDSESKMVEDAAQGAAKAVVTATP